MQITLKPELEQYVKDRAQRVGYDDASEYVAHLVETDRAAHPDPSDHASTSRRSVVEELKEFSKGNTLGDDLTVKDLINEGRRI